MIVSVKPLGAVPFDGMTLPLTSPDGRFIATQSGATPSFATLLAEPGASAPYALRITAASISDAAATDPNISISPLGWSNTLPRGLLLGRSATSRGFLVESPQADGSRRIGIVDWVSGTLTWVFDSPGVIGAFASFGPNGELAYSRRKLDAPHFELVVRTDPFDPGTESVLVPPTPDESFVFPTFSADRSHMYAFRVATSFVPRFGPLTLMAVRLPGRTGDELTVASRAELGVEPTIAAAFQAVAPLQTPWPLDADKTPDPLARGIALTNLADQSMLWIDGTSGDSQPLARLTAGAVPLVELDANNQPELRGLFLGTAKELVFQPFRGIENAGLMPSQMWGNDAGVVSGPFIPRLAGWFQLQTQRRPRFILLAPPKQGSSSTVSVVHLIPAD